MLALLLTLTADAGGLAFATLPTLDQGQDPAFMVTPDTDVTLCQVVIQAGDQTWKHERSGTAAGEQLRFEWPRDESVTSANVRVFCEFTDGSEAESVVPLEYAYGGPLAVDLAQAKADVGKRTLTVSVSAPVERAEIIAYGARKAVLDETTVPLSGGPGEVEIPWVGRASDVVLLDVKLHGARGWVSFTYSPWFLDIPHEDVRFASGQHAIPEEEAPKLNATLAQLTDVLDKYGAVVPVKLYIAGCTDTVGDAGSNKGLSERRARAIAAWLRAHGYDRPIYTHGFGEGLLAVKTGDEVDNAANRRVLYMVGADAPPAGSGIPSVRWTPL
ncbi:MAG: outer membrane protein OmpA-like peptidoglycan-associated protein [Myxococcota bacterium]